MNDTSNTQTTDDSTTHTWTSDNPTQQPGRTRPCGPSWGTIVFGLICLVVAGGMALVHLTDVQLEWQQFGPTGLIALGSGLVLIGLIAAVLRRR